MNIRSAFARFLLVPMVFGTDAVQGCSITLISADLTHQQVFCSPTPSVIIEPIVYLIDDTGYMITGLPTGVSAELVNDTLSIHGALNTFGEWYYTLSTVNGCSTSGVLEFNEAIDPALSCSVDGQSITFSWLQELEDPPASGNIVVTWAYGSEAETEVFFLPTPSTYTVSNIPPGTEVHFYWSLYDGHPFCFDSLAEITCSTTPLGILDQEQAPFNFSPNPVGPIIQLTGPEPIDQVRIFDLLGHEVNPPTVPLRSGQVHVPSLVPGTYLMQLMSNGHTYHLRFIKE